MTTTDPRLPRTRAILGVLLVLFVLAAPPRAAEAQTGFDPYPADIVDDRAPVNGCGSQGPDGTDVPDEWFGTSFTPACDWHDQCYGTKGLSQSYCDKGMLDKNLDACGGDGACEAVAVVYYAGVATLGGEPYRDGQFAACTRTPHRDARAHGDPHLATFDGLNYDLMTAGEFTLVRDADGRDAVQARFHPTSDTFTVVDGIAVRLGAHEAVVQLDPATSELAVFLDGEPVTTSIAAVPEGFVELGEKLEGVSQVVTIRRDDGLRVEGIVFASRIDIGINVFEPQWGRVSGLLGDADGEPANDIVTDGEVVDASDPRAPSFVRGLYESGFAESWRVAPDDSMFIPGGDFDYHGEEARSYPREIITLESFFGDEVEQARVQCAGEGLEEPALTTCMFDVLASGDDSYAETAARSATRATTVASPELAVPAAEVGSPGGSGVAAETVPSSPLVEAALAGDVDEVRRLVDAGEPVDVASERHGVTPLTAAVFAGSVELMQVLLDAGADPDAVAPRGFLTPLVQAAANGDVDAVDLLLDAGADPDGAGLDDGSLSPLASAAAHPAVVEVLLEAGADPDGTVGSTPPLVAAAGAGQVAAARLLVEAGATVDVDTDEGAGVTTPLAVAVFGQRVEMVRYLVTEAGANPDIEIAPGTPLSSVTFNDEIRDLLGG